MRYRHIAGGVATLVGGVILGWVLIGTGVSHRDLCWGDGGVPPQVGASHDGWRGDGAIHCAVDGRPTGVLAAYQRAFRAAGWDVDADWEPWKDWPQWWRPPSRVYAGEIVGFVAHDYSCLQGFNVGVVMVVPNALGGTDVFIEKLHGPCPSR